MALAEAAVAVAVAKAVAPVVVDDAAAVAVVVVAVVVAAAVAAAVEFRRARLIRPGAPCRAKPRTGPDPAEVLAVTRFMAPQPAHARMPG